MYPSHTPGRPLLAIGVALSLAAGLAACSSNSKSAKTTTSSAVATLATTPATAADSTEATEASTAPTDSIPTTDAGTTTTIHDVATTTTVPGPPVYPLTGVLVSDPAVAALPAIVVKIDNAPPARPQSGFNEADMVFEEIVNDNLTRFAMVFQTQQSDVGPIRSGRIQDINLFSMLNHPLFVWSGGNKTVTDAVNASELINLSQLKVGIYRRTSDKAVPHNLYTTIKQVRTKTPVGAGPPQQIFSYRADGSPAAGVPSPAVAVTLDSINVRWDWDAAKGLYKRTMEGKPHSDALSGQVTTNNVVILNMKYVPGISDSPDAQTIGTGEAFVMTGGNYIHGTWTRADIHAPITLTADDGSIIKLQPGRTFIELPRPGNVLVIPAK